jgi:heat shock protein HslJ
VAWAALCTALLAASCADEGTLTGPSVLTGTLWKLQAVAIASAGTTTVVDPARYTVEFGEQGRLLARADCNVCSSEYGGLRKALTVGRFACTRAFCGPESRGDEYVAILEQARLYEVTGDTLTIVSSNGILYYRR